ncbi:MAG: trigger factor [Elusimicrobia bacterium CG08_land_8_20_14_0_20_44_26]|nr:MAG: trigger factor [Elusimicrobia bacterium CG08_land_8_20_14_0_20_44_26]
MEGIKILEKSKTLKSVLFKIDDNTGRRSLSHALNKLKSSVSVPGFRKGKVPDTFLTKEYSGELKDEREKFIISEKLRQLADDNSLRAVSPARLMEFKWSGDVPESFSVELEVIPEFDVSGYKKIPIKKNSKEVTEEDIKKAVLNLRETAARLKSVEKEKPEENLFIKYDMEILEAGGSVKGISRKNLLAEISKEKLMQGLWPDILNLVKNTPGDITFEAPADFEIRSLAGKKMTFRIKITDILEKILPEADDKFAQLFGAKNLNELEEVLKNRLIAEFEIENTRYIREQITDYILKKNPLEIPRSMLDEEKHSMTDTLKKEYPDRKIESMEKEIETLSRKNISLALLLGKIAEKENITLTEDDFKNKLGEKYGKENANRLKNTLLTDKIFDFIIKEGKIK